MESLYLFLLFYHLEREQGHGLRVRMEKDISIGDTDSEWTREKWRDCWIALKVSGLSFKEAIQDPVCFPPAMIASMDAVQEQVGG